MDEYWLVQNKEIVDLVKKITARNKHIIELEV